MYLENSIFEQDSYLLPMIPKGMGSHYSLDQDNALPFTKLGAMQNYDIASQDGLPMNPRGVPMQGVPIQGVPMQGMGWNFITEPPDGFGAVNWDKVSNTSTDIISAAAQILPALSNQRSGPAYSQEAVQRALQQQQPQVVQAQPSKSEIPWGWIFAGVAGVAVVGFAVMKRSEKKK